MAASMRPRGVSTRWRGGKQSRCGGIAAALIALFLAALPFHRELDEGRDAAAQLRRCFLAAGTPTATSKRSRAQCPPPRAPAAAPARVAVAASGGTAAEEEGEWLLSPLDRWVDDKLGFVREATASELGKQVQDVVGEERLESVKAGAVAVAFGAVPEAVAAWLDPERLTPRWEFQLDMLAFQILLFGLVYRYAVREGDDKAGNGMQQAIGVLTAFVLPRALFMVEMPSECTPAPLSCGPPLGYFSWSMLAQVAKQAAIGGVALGGALYGLERAFTVGAVRRFRGASPPVAAEAETAAPTEAGWKWPW